MRISNTVRLLVTIAFLATMFSGCYITMYNNHLNDEEEKPELEPGDIVYIPYPVPKPILVPVPGPIIYPPLQPELPYIPPQQTKPEPPKILFRNPETTTPDRQRKGDNSADRLRDNDGGRSGRNNNRTETRRR